MKRVRAFWSSKYGRLVPVMVANVVFLIANGWFALTGGELRILNIIAGAVLAMMMGYVIGYVRGIEHAWRDADELLEEAHGFLKQQNDLLIQQHRVITQGMPFAQPPDEHQELVH